MRTVLTKESASFAGKMGYEPEIFKQCLLSYHSFMTVEKDKRDALYAVMKKQLSGKRKTA